MKLLLTSGGIRNESIRTALQNMLGKPFEECDAVLIPTATYGHPYAGPKAAFNAIANTHGHGMGALGWNSVALIELTALPSMREEVWLPVVENADVMLVEGGDAAYLRHWMDESGMTARLPDLKAVYVGMSAGSMVMTPRTGPAFINWPEPRADDTLLGFVDFSIFPHMDYPGWETNTRAAAQKWFETMDVPAYGLDDQSAIQVIDGEVEVISEGDWVKFERS